jgi:hypothetical protein
MKLKLQLRQGMAAMAARVFVAKNSFLLVAQMEATAEMAVESTSGPMRA